MAKKRAVNKPNRKGVAISAYINENVMADLRRELEEAQLETNRNPGSSATPTLTSVLHEAIELWLVKRQKAKTKRS